MAFTKITLSGVVSTIKQVSTLFNDFIDDLLSTSNGLGASQVGIEDSAGNMSAANVEDGLAEIYADIAGFQTIADVLDENPTTTTGTTWGYKGGLIFLNGTTTTITAATVGLTDNATNYIEIDASGNVVKNTTGWNTGKLPIRQVIVASGVQTSTDKRAWFSSYADASATASGVIELATSAEVKTGTDTGRAVTPAGLISAESAVKAWINFNGTGTIAIRDSFNVTSITDLVGEAGHYTITWDVDFANTNYVCMGMTGDDIVATFIMAYPVANFLVGSIDIYLFDDAGALQDNEIVNIMAMGAQ